MGNKIIADRDWHGADWWSLRNSLLNACTQNAQGFLEQIQSDVATIEEIAEEFFNHMIAQIKSHSDLDAKFQATQKLRLLESSYIDTDRTNTVLHPSNPH